MNRLYWRGLLAALIVVLTVVPASADERFAVEVAVDVTDQNASAARERAMSEANRAAIVAVAKRISTAEGAAKLAEMTDDQLINFIKEVSVIDEKSSSIRYIANLRVVLNEDMLREYMTQRGIPLLLGGHTRVLVVPLLRDMPGTAPLLWESTNRWREAWGALSQGAAAQFVLLPANATNFALTEVSRLEAMDGEMLDKLMRFNRADDVYVLTAEPDGNGGMEVLAMSYSGDNRVIRVAGNSEEPDQIFAAAAEQTAAAIEGRVKQQNLREAEQEAQATVLYEFSGLRQWVEAEKVLKSIPYVKSIDVQAMGTHKAQFKLIFAGSTSKLLSALAAKGYGLEENGNYFRLIRQGN